MSAVSPILLSPAKPGNLCVGFQLTDFRRRLTAQVDAQHLGELSRTQVTLCHRISTN